MRKALSRGKFRILWGKKTGEKPSKRGNLALDSQQPGSIPDSERKLGGRSLLLLKLLYLGFLRSKVDDV